MPADFFLQAFFLNKVGIANNASIKKAKPLDS
jgi:hypothetical protein